MLGFFLATLAGVVVGTINGMAGGASIISYPVLLALGLNIVVGYAGLPRPVAPDRRAGRA